MSILSIILFIIGLLPILHYIFVGGWDSPPIISFLIILAVLTYWNNLASKKIYKKKEADLNKEFTEKLSALKKKELDCKKIISSTHPFSKSASMITDTTLSIFDDISNHLKYKSHPAIKSADIIKSLKRSILNTSIYIKKCFISRSS